MTIRLLLLLVLTGMAAVLGVSPALATCGVGTSFPQCDDVCPPGLVCANAGGVCGCQPPAAACQDPGNPDGAPVCYGSCPNPAQPICATLVGGCACIPTLSEWGIIAMTLVMLAVVLRGRRRSGLVQVRWPSW